MQNIKDESSDWDTSDEEMRGFVPAKRSAVEKNKSSPPKNVSIAHLRSRHMLSNWLQTPRMKKYRVNSRVKIVGREKIYTIQTVYEDTTNLKWTYDLVDAEGNVVKDKKPGQIKLHDPTNANGI